MLTKRAKAYSSSCSQTVSLSPAILLQFILRLCAAAENRKNQFKNRLFWKVEAIKMCLTVKRECRPYFAMWRRASFVPRSPMTTSTKTWLGATSSEGTWTMTYYRRLFLRSLMASDPAPNTNKYLSK